MSIETIQHLPSGPIENRGIKEVITEHYGVKFDKDGNHFYPLTNKLGEVVAYKKRTLPKSFTFLGDSKKVDQLFGQSVAIGKRMLVITEGEIDCLSVAQCQYDKYQKHFPAVSIPSAATLKPLLENRTWIRSFDTVVLAFDSDGPGQKAVAEAAKIIGYDKVRVAQFPEKDPNEVLLERGGKELLNAIFDARTYTPEGVVAGEAIWEHYRDQASVEAVPYPEALRGINEHLRGMRAGEIAFFTSGTGSGKSTLIKEIVLELLSYEQSDEINKIGLIFLEEAVGDTAEKLIGMHLKKDVTKEKLPEERLRKAFEDLFSDERLIIVNHQGAVDDSSLIDQMEYLALSGCTHLLLDHITIATSEIVSDGRGSNETTDSVMSNLLKLVKKHNLWLGLVGHLRKTDNRSKSFEQGRIPSMDDIKGSGAIKQISFDIIAFARDMTAKDPLVRNTIKLRVLKARKTGSTGDAGAVRYNPETTRIEYVDLEDFNDMEEEDE